MAGLKPICFFSLILLPSLGACSFSAEKKWVAGEIGYRAGFDSGHYTSRFCLPGICLGGGIHWDGGASSTCANRWGAKAGCHGNPSRSELGQAMYCRPISCPTGACGGLPMVMNQGLYQSLANTNPLINKERKFSLFADKNKFKGFTKRGQDGDDDEVQEMMQAAMAPESK